MAQHNHFPYLDGWRGLAIVCLLTGHFFPIPGINLGQVGVHLFFVLSGLLMARILFIQKAPLGQFYRRRIARIMPSVYVYLTVVSLLFVLAGQQISLRELLSAATFTNNYVQAIGPWTMPFGHIWSLSVEEHAYVLLSLLALATRASRRRSIVVLAVAATLSAASAGVHYLVLDRAAVAQVWSHSEVAAFGILASSLLLVVGAGLPAARDTPASRMLHAAAPTLAPLLLLAGLTMHWWSLAAPLRIVGGCAAFALALHLLHLRPSALRRLFELAPLRQLGLWSFSLYLWQQPFYQLVHRQGLHPVLGLGLALLVGIAAFYLIEQPARSWLNRRWAARPTPGDAAPVNAAPASLAS